MPNVAACPEAPVIQQFTRGELPPNHVEPLAGHLCACDKCFQRLLETAPTPQALVAGLSSTFRIDASPVLQGLVGRLRSIPAPAAAGSSEDATSGPTREGDSGGRSLSFEVKDILSPAQGPDELGRLGTYRVLKVLGRGGMGVVFLAEDTHLQRKVALKAMLPDRTQGTIGDSARQRFLREARMAASLKHDHVVTIYQVGEDRGIPYLAMEFLEGMALDDWLKGGRKPSVGQILKLGREIALGLAAAHEQKMIHRDIKPGNIWLDASAGGRVKILDFGLARAVSSGDVNITHSGAIVGTPAYMAPEQARSETIDHRADLFSLGVVLYRMATGQMPFTGHNVMATLASIALDTPRPVRDLNPDIPEPLADMIMSLLSKDPAQRPASARALATALATINKQRSSQPQPEGTPKEFTEFLPSPRIPKRSGVRSSAKLEKPAPAAAPGKRRPWKLYAIGSAVLVFLLVGSWFFGLTVIRIATNTGELVVQVEDRNVEAMIKQNGSVVRDKTWERKFVLPAGAGEVELFDPDGFNVVTRPFTVRRAGRETVVVTPQDLTEGRNSPRRLGPPGPFDALRQDQVPPVSLANAVGGDPKKAPPELAAVLGDTRWRHLSQVNGGAFNPKGNLFAACDDAGIRVWEVASGKTMQSFAV